MRQHREFRLRAALSSRGLELRSDSYLCASYVNGDDTALALSTVVDRMEEMHWLYSCTMYHMTFQLIMEERRDEAHRMAHDHAANEDAPNSMIDPAKFYLEL